MADPYSTLGISRNASEKDIKSAYRTLAKELHPDRNKDNPQATERFSKVTQAYDLLTDKEKRGQFDRGEIDGDGNPTSPFGMGGRGGGGFHGGGQRSYSSQDFGGMGGESPDLSDLFEGIFGRGGPGMGGAGMGGRAGTRGGHRAPPRKGADVRYRLKVPFTDAASRKDQRITLSDGKTIDLKLPAGVEDGTQMRLKGKGEAGPGGAGDGLVTIEIDSHAFFERDGDDVRLDLPLTLNEAVNGAKVRVPTVDGAVMLTVAAGSSSGRVLRLKGKGFTRKNGDRGDQLVRLEIILPDDVSELASRLEGWEDAQNARSALGE
ncbi:DnaJ C-terminal domain-containing protein [Altericroceibacterium endophyticum]|uniref:DnaJ domain-containing protein n=1 Tax=Altericroceibacterium endophyticum TaxID=1808508 RepID=A0A6I4T6S5_9SPHN|nr:J domain-containing protein [Altericroceibacterium endophyticum]MXO65703.1 DnaJ domain-containing protein [Altericroceibacterium endophyticum]